MNAGARYQELAALVASDRARRCAEAEARGREAARRLIAQARAEARRRAATVFGELRARAERDVRAAHAALETAHRRRRFAGERALLERGMQQLPQALLARWQDPEARRAWTRAVLEVAARLLPPGPRRIECPASLGAAERRALGETVLAQDDLEAGIRVRGELACVDGSLAGLLADRRVLEARLLAEAQAP